MAGIEAEKIVSNTEEKTTTEPPQKTVHTDDSTTAVEVEIKGEEVPKLDKETNKTETPPVKEEKLVEIPATVEEKDVKPAVEEKDVEVKT